MATRSTIAVLMALAVVAFAADHEGTDPSHEYSVLADHWCDFEKIKGYKDVLEATQCAELCDEEAECHIFLHDKERAVCYLTAACTDTQPTGENRPGRTMGLKVDVTPEQLDSTSKSCCEDLPFDNKDLNTVCSAASWQDGQECELGATFDEAFKMCNDVGARLCTFQELARGDAVNSGCEKKEQVWTATPCGGSGHVTGMALGGWDKTCKDSEGDEAAVICCADVCGKDHSVLKDGINANTGESRKLRFL